jgi:type I restriction enzyme, S subunit
MAKTGERKLPSDWCIRPLSQVAAVQTGIAKGRRQIVDPVELPYLRVANVHFGRLDLEEVKTILISKRDVTRYQLRPGDILLTEGGDFDKLGRGTIWRGELEPCLHQNHIFAVRCDLCQVMPEWIALLTESSYGRRYFTLCSKQSTNLASINSTQLKRFPVPLPSLDEQATVISRIATADDCRTQIQRLLSLKSRMRRGIAHQLLTGQLRFPEFAGTPWVERPLKELFSERNETNRGDLELLSVTADRGIVAREELERRDTSNADKSKYKRVAIGDIAYNTMRMWQGVSALSSREGIVSPAYTVVVAGSRILPAFARHLFKLPAVVHLFFRYSQGLVDDTLNLKYERFVKVRVRIPTALEEQRRIAETLDLADREIGLLEALAQQTALQKRGLMQKLLTGEFRVLETFEAPA